MKSIILLLGVVGWIVPFAAAAAAHGCHQQPYDHMQHFRNWDPARKFCHHHWPAPTTRKTVWPKCLTTTSTVVEGSTTVTATKTKHCHTHEHSPPPSSVYPVPYEKVEATKRDAAPAPTSPALKREALPAPNWGDGKGNHPWEHRPEPVGHHELGDHNGWKGYLGRLNECGYECVQRACSCIARTHTIHVSMHLVSIMDILTHTSFSTHRSRPAQRLRPVIPLSPKQPPVSSKYLVQLELILRRMLTEAVLRRGTLASLKVVITLAVHMVAVGDWSSNTAKMRFTRFVCSRRCFGALHRLCLTRFRVYDNVPFLCVTTLTQHELFYVS